MIDAKTSILGLLGQPVGHSLSPAIHNAALAEMGLNWCYLALSCKTNDLTKILEGLRCVECKGLNITIPHKQSVAKICKNLSPLAQELGAVNTLIPTENGEWKGANTDVEGFLAPLKTSEIDWKSKEVVVLGCGGSARAVIAGLQKLEVSRITILNRSEKNLQMFLSDIEMHQANQKQLKIRKSQVTGCLYKDPKLKKYISSADLIVNTTPVGMSTSPAQAINKNQLPLEEKIWKTVKPKITFYDLIYTPRPTAWLRLGAEHGHQCIDGLEMLIEQGAASLRLWSGIKDIPINVMKNAAKVSLRT